MAIKEEPKSDALPPVLSTGTSNSLFRSIVKNGCEILELLDSDDDMEPESTSPLDEDKGMSSDTMVEDLDLEMVSDDDNADPHLYYDQEKSGSSLDIGSDSDESDIDHPTPSNWLDDHISSTVKQGPILITRQCTVEVLEYLSDLPSYWPVPREKRAYLVNLSDPKWNILDKNGKPISVDGLLKNSVRTQINLLFLKFNRHSSIVQDQDSWTGCTGNGPQDSRPKVLASVFGLKLEDFPQGIICRRSRLKCAAFLACEHVNPALINQERYELNPESLEGVLEIQIDARV